MWCAIADDGRKFYGSSKTQAEARRLGHAQQQPEPDEFLLGVCVTLGIITSFDAPVIWAEIVNCVGVDQLLHYAAHVEPAEWELAGFKKYARIELNRGKPRLKR